jgi:hypothetical protein
MRNVLGVQELLALETADAAGPMQA